MEESDGLAIAPQKTIQSPKEYLGKFSCISKNAQPAITSGCALFFKSSPRAWMAFLPSLITAHLRDSHFVHLPLTSIDREEVIYSRRIAAFGFLESTATRFRCFSRALAMRTAALACHPSV